MPSTLPRPNDFYSPINSNGQDDQSEENNIMQHKLVGAISLSTEGDTLITGFPSNYVLHRAYFLNANGSVTTAQASLYTGAGKTGTQIAPPQLLDALDGGANALQDVIFSVAGEERMVYQDLRLHIETPESNTRTVDLVIIYEDYTL